MYIGVFTVGADLTGGLLTLSSIRKRKRKVVLIFKDFHANFFKRAEQDVIFICRDGAAIDHAVQQAVDKGERINLPIKYHSHATPKILRTILWLISGYPFL
jgi:hypothetical protein